VSSGPHPRGRRSHRNHRGGSLSILPSRLHAEVVRDLHLLLAPSPASAVRQREPPPLRQVVRAGTLAGSRPRGSAERVHTPRAAPPRRPLRQRQWRGEVPCRCGRGGGARTRCCQVRHHWERAPPTQARRSRTDRPTWVHHPHAKGVVTTSAHQRATPTAQAKNSHSRRCTSRIDQDLIKLWKSQPALDEEETVHSGY
jgi:hypothetical protein